MTHTGIGTQKKGAKTNGRMSTVNGGNDTKSVCGKFTLSDQNKQYFKHDFAIDLLNEIKEKQIVFSSMAELREELVDKINSDNSKSVSSIKYDASLTEKYVTLKCRQGCKFNFWFQNKDQKDMKSFFVKNFTKKNLQIAEENKNKINVKFFRSINQNHEKKMHPEVQF